MKFFKSKFKKIALIKIIAFCNQDCIFCHEALNFNNKFLKIDEIKRIVVELKRGGYDSVLLSGGEPFLHPKIEEIISLFAKNKFKIIIITNGSLLHQINNNILKLVDRFYISLHANNESSNYLITRKKYFKIIVSNIKKLITLRKEVIVRFTINNLNIKSRGKFLSLMANVLKNTGKIELANLEIKGKVKKGSRLIPNIRNTIYIINYFSKKSKQLIFDAIPFCLLNLKGQRIDDLIYKIKMRIYQDNKGHLIFQEIKNKINKNKICAECKEINKCFGWPAIFNKADLIKYANK